jgi:hypothetical protein
MRILTTALLCLLVAHVTNAGEDPKPNTLTPKQIRDGWLLLFDGETTYGWYGPLLASNPNRYGAIGGNATVAAGVLQLGGEKESSAWFGAPFSNFQLDFEYRLETRPGAVFVTHFLPSAVPGGGKGFLRADGQGWHRCTITARSDRATGQFTIQHEHFSPSGVLAHQSYSARAGLKQTLKLGFRVPAGGKLLLRNVKLKPWADYTLFNGEDLTGWNEHPDKKSKFSVTPQGWLNVKNGPGDLQTTKQFRDFLLQLECISNGKHLNSGIFIRAIPGQYQQGYEAQIHNGFNPEKPRAYTVDQYDPETHKKTGTIKVESAAIDYGTGAIYRRMPARKQMAKDHEWFAMTVVAHGNHFATWVNGVQVCDWTDDRPANDNARQGCCLNPGAVSIQGHDPTTDLSFRNIRIAELPSPTKDKRP